MILNSASAAEAASTGAEGPFRLLRLIQSMLSDLPVGLLVLGQDGTPLWFNREAELVCAVWNHGERRGTALRLTPAVFCVPPPVLEECRTQLAAWFAHGVRPRPGLIVETDQGLYARVTLEPPADGADPVGFCVHLDYRRPRTDRDRPLSQEALALCARLTPREREVALKIRDGLSTLEIAHQLRRSPLTIKTQLAGIFRKLDTKSRVRVAILLNR